MLDRTEAGIAMISSIFLSLLVLPASGVVPASHADNDAPQWVSLTETLQSEPSPDNPRRRRLGQKSPSLSGEPESPFQRNYIDSLGTAFEEYAQAWRVLGIYIDCKSNDSANSQQRRQLEEKNGDGETTSMTCGRYVLWAAYADINYSGGGLSEYKFFDSETNRWDSSACRSSGGRCVRMDCHLPSSDNFRLLGYYKQYDVEEFLDSLIQHHGSCTWREETRSLMENTYDMWPNACSPSGIITSVGDELFLDRKPGSQGTMEIGLYTDELCVHVYKGRDVKLKQALYSYAQTKGGNGYRAQTTNNNGEPSFGSVDYFAAWNKALAEYQICQPCMASNVYTSFHNNNGRFLEDEDAEDTVFECADSTGNTNTNQCMLLAKKTQISAAYYRDVQLATRQGSIARSNAVGLSNRPVGKRWDSWGFLVVSSVVFCAGMVTFSCLVKIKTRVRSPSSSIGSSSHGSPSPEPLVLKLTGEDTLPSTFPSTVIRPTPSQISPTSTTAVRDVSETVVRRIQPTRTSSGKPSVSSTQAPGTSLGKRRVAPLDAVQQILQEQGSI